MAREKMKSTGADVAAVIGLNHLSDFGVGHWGWSASTYKMTGFRCQQLSDPQTENTEHKWTTRASWALAGGSMAS